MYLTAIDRTIPQKLYFQLLEIMQGHIETGGWKVGSQVPTEDQLCSQYNVSKATVRLAVAELVSLGYLKKIQGKGTFVRRRKPGDSIPMLLNLGEDHCPACIVRIFEHKTVLPDEETRDHLNLAENTPCLFIARMVIAEGVPRVIQKILVPSALMQTSFPSPEAEELQRRLALHSFLEAGCGTKIQRAKEMTDVIRIGEQDAKLLELAPGEPVLRVRHLCYMQGDEPISCSESIYRTDDYARTLELERLRM